MVAYVVDHGVDEQTAWEFDEHELIARTVVLIEQNSNWRYDFDNDKWWREEK